MVSAKYQSTFISKTLEHRKSYFQIFAADSRSHRIILPKFYLSGNLRKKKKSKDLKKIIRPIFINFNEDLVMLLMSGNFDRDCIFRFYHLNTGT